MLKHRPYEDPGGLSEEAGGYLAWRKVGSG